MVVRLGLNLTRYKTVGICEMEYLFGERVFVPKKIILGFFHVSLCLPAFVARILLGTNYLVIIQFKSHSVNNVCR